MTAQHVSASIRRTAREIARRPGPKLPLGKCVWRLTNEVRLPSPVSEVSGSYGQELVYTTRGGKTFRRRYVVPEDPKTGRQVDHRTRWTVVQPHWKEVPAADRLAWGEYAAEHFHPERRGKAVGGIGQNLYTSAQTNRLGWGGEMTDSPPVLPPPPPVLSLAEVPAPEGQFAFEVRHALAAPTGYRLEVKTTPATPNGRKPRETDRRRAGETSPESFFPLAESGAVYLLARPRFSIAAGERYGVWVRLLTPDGVPGSELYADLIRMGAAEEEVPVEKGEDGEEGAAQAETASFTTEDTESTEEASGGHQIGSLLPGTSGLCLTDSPPVAGGGPFLGGTGRGIRMSLRAHMEPRVSRRGRSPAPAPRSKCGCVLFVQAKFRQRE